MSGEQYVPPRPWMSEELQEFIKRATAAGNVVGTEWDLQAQRDVIRENQARHAGVYRMQQTKHHAGELARELAPYGDPARLGEALMRAAAFLGGMAVQGAGPDDVVNLLAFAGYEVYEGRTS